MQKWIKIKQIFQYFLKIKATLHAASASYYIFLSILPASIILLNIVFSVPGLSDKLYDISASVLPADFLYLLDRIWLLLLQDRSISLFSFSVLTALWSISKGILAIMDGLSAVTEIKSDTIYWRRRLYASVYFFLFLLISLLAMTLILFGKELVLWLFAAFPNRTGLLEQLIRSRLVLFTVLLSVLFGFMYWLVLRRDLLFRSCWLGGMMSALVCMIFSLGFTIYSRYLSVYARSYGSLGHTILFMIWLHSCIILFFYGGVASKWINHKFLRVDHTKKDRNIDRS